MSWKDVPTERYRGESVPFLLSQYVCEHCGKEDWSVFGYGPHRQLHLFCRACDEVTCLHLGKCVADQQRWLLPEHDPLEEAPAPDQPPGGA